jgi:hypothetical protein
LAPRSRLRRWRRLPDPFQADTAVPTASQSFLVPRYPGFIDTKPDLEDGTTYLTSLYLDFLQLVVESVEATIGPLDENQNNQIFGQGDFRDFLDLHSLGGATDSGKIVGIYRVCRRATVAASTGWAKFSVALNVQKTTNSVPVLMGVMNRQHTGAGRVHTLANFLAGAASCRGNVQQTAPGNFVIDLQAINLNGTGTPARPAGNEEFVFTGFILFLERSRSY